MLSAIYVKVQNPFPSLHLFFFLWVELSITELACKARRMDSRDDCLETVEERTRSFRWA